ncbi:hypothetical protein TNCV_2747781 [Trichonephila clavipes]|nr:hypothetical protein TNCV_2747781 [Trichonephila clavipes]
MQIRQVITNTDTLYPDLVLRCMPPKGTRMLSEKDKALLVELFFINKESATDALRKFRLQKNVKSGKGPSTVVRLINLVQRFEETGSLEDRVRSGKPSLRIISKHCNFTWYPRSPDLTPVDFSLLGY